MLQLHTIKRGCKKANVAFTICHIFTVQYLHICNIFAGSKFVQIHFFRPVLEFADSWKTAINSHKFAAK